MLSSILVILPFFSVIRAANDWNVPCITGQCSYDLPTANGASGTMTIWGSQDSIADITTAADWQILTCNSTTLSQSIRLVCTNDAADSNCNNLYQTTGAVNKIVRLPESCGSGPFARVVNASVSEDQTLPASLAARLVRRDGTQPEVKTLSLDVNFGAVDYSTTGPVNIAVKSANVPGVASSAIQVPPSRRATRLSQRALADFVPNAISDISNDVNLNQTVELPPLTFDKKVDLFNQTIDCGPVNAAVDVSVDGNTAATASVGVAATGTLVPPKFDSFGVIGILNGNVAGTLDITADVNGQVDSGKVTLLSLPIAGIDIPGILTVGPTFQLQAQLTGNFDVNLDMQVGINLALDNATLSFPSNSGGPKTNGASFSLGDTPLTLSASPDVTATGSIEAHLIPSINLGVSALGDVAKAQVSLSLDASATLKLNLDGSADVSTVIDNNGSSTTTDDSKGSDSTTVDKTVVVTKTKVVDVTVTKQVTVTKTVTEEGKMYMTTQTMPTTYVTQSTSYGYRTAYQTPAPAKTSSASMASSTTASAQSDKSAYSRRAVSASGSFGGSFQVDAGIDVTASADASFFGLFDPNVSDSLFSKNFVLFQKSFGNNSGSSRRSLFTRRRAADLRARADLQCPAANLGTPASLVDETVKASAIKAI
ncbi:hypothetical protein FB45DRAFT_949592 [Roridomyces roridus]|uniref:DUF7223 domain-containing protein n=1 Tax=Roridomyces roridus TaxID=1738132 RepID=A0AAD7B0G3_9AGAR|nr:hypothetical protein FB45DRAFT_949592 [Roridomyces roridus]